MPLSKILLDVVDAVGQGDGDHLSALARRQRSRARRPRPSARAPTSVALSRIFAPARPAPASASSSAPKTGSGPRRSPGCRCRPRPGTPDAIEPLDRRIADADPLIAARAGHQRRAELAPAARSAVSSNCTPWTTSVCASITPWRSRYSTGPQAGICPVVAPRADRLEHAAPRAAARREQLDLFGRLAEMDARDRARRCRSPPRGSRGTARATSNTARAARARRATPWRPPRRRCVARRLDRARRRAP